MNGVTRPRTPIDGRLDVEAERLLINGDGVHGDDARSDGASQPLSPTSRRQQTGEQAARKLTFLNGLALVVSLQIGSGIFVAPSQISQHVPSPGAGVLVWFLAGLLVWTGAECFIELGLAIPENGGIQEYLRHCYGDFMGCLFTWSWVVIAKGSANAIITGVFASYVCRAVTGRDDLPWWIVRVVGLSGLWVITLINCSGAKAGANAANVFAVVKVSALCLVTVMGIVAAVSGVGDGVISSENGWFGVDPSEPELSLADRVGTLVTATFGALYSYGGWEAIGFVAGDMDNPQKNLPRVLTTAMMVVVSLFVLYNGSLYAVLPLETLRRSTTPVIDFALRLLGVPGSVVFSIIIASSAIGALNANTFSIAALCVAASRRGYAPKILGNLHCTEAEEEPGYLRDNLNHLPKWILSPLSFLSTRTARHRLDKNIPIYPLIFNATLASCYFIVGTFNDLVTFVGLSEYFFFFLSVLGIFVLRRQPAYKAAGQGNAYRTWIGNPIIFTICSAFILVRGIMSNWIQGAALLAMVLVTWVVFAGFVQRKGAGATGVLRR